jgi:hypothetical protein
LSREDKFRTAAPDRPTRQQSGAARRQPPRWAAVLDYPEGYQNFVFADGSGGISITPEGEDIESEAMRGFVFGKSCTLETHRAMAQEDALGIGPGIVELLRNLKE